MASNFKRKFMGGMCTPREAHSRLAFPPGAACATCKRPPVARAIVMAPLDECIKHELVPPEAAANPGVLLPITVQLNESVGSSALNPKPYIRLSITYACQQCLPVMERQAARGPSWMVVDIDRGPAADKIVTSGVS